MTIPDPLQKPFPVAATSAVVLAANTGRRGVSVQNVDTARSLYLAYAATATTTTSVVKIGPGRLWEMPTKALGHVEYFGAISGIWDGASGAAALVKEVY